MIKFFYNGLKVDGGELHGCYFRFSVEDNKPVVKVWAKNYIHFPKEVWTTFSVHNASDSMSDYFDVDGFEIHPDSPFWEIALKMCTKNFERNITRNEKHSTRMRESVSNRSVALIEEIKQYLSKVA